MAKNSHGNPVSIRLPDSLLLEIGTVAKNIGLSHADTIRKSAQLGLPVLLHMLGRKAAAKRKAA
jgi:hypothetical protein